MLEFYSFFPITKLYLTKELVINILGDNMSFSQANTAIFVEYVVSTSAMSFQGNSFTFKTTIGQGCMGFSNVSVALHRTQNKYYAVKKTCLENCPIDLDNVKNDITYQRQLSHAAILPIVDTFVQGQVLWTVMPLMEFGSCRDVLHAHFTNGFPEAAISLILNMVLDGLVHLHEQAIIHRSVRASHVLLGADGRVQLTGFRHACRLTKQPRGRPVTHEFPANYEDSLLWASPELLEQGVSGYDTQSDIYSVGITACELANGVAPFADIPFTEMLLNKLGGIQPKLLDTTTIDTGDGPSSNGSVTNSGRNLGPAHRTFSNYFHHFADRCLQADPLYRTPAGALLQHGFFRQSRRMSLTLTHLLQPVSPLTPATLDALAAQAEDVDGLSGSVGSLALESWTF